MFNFFSVKLKRNSVTTNSYLKKEKIQKKS